MLKKLLIVEDYENLARTLENMLLKYFRDIDVIMFTSMSASGKAIEYLEKESPEIALAIIDLRINGKSGIDVINVLKGVSPNCGIIVLTRCTDDDEMFIEAKTKADIVLRKPVDFRELENVIDRFHVMESVTPQVAWA